jgi:hypothetical protein
MDRRYVPLLSFKGGLNALEMFLPSHGMENAVEIFRFFSSFFILLESTTNFFSTVLKIKVFLAIQ